MTHRIEQQDVLGSIFAIAKTDTNFLIVYETGELANLSILNNHVFRYYMSPSGDFLDYPIPNNSDDIAKINIKNMTDYDKEAFENSTLDENDYTYFIHTSKIKILFDKSKGTMSVHDNRTDKVVLEECKPISYVNSKAKQSLLHHKDEYFYGGGMQNGRFSHKGEIIDIVNSNDWIDGGVTSPCPFFWSTYGYGVLRNTWQPGTYDFGSKEKDTVQTIHQETYFDAFFFVNSQPKDILNDYYELTGQPIFMPEYAFYEAHLNTFNRDYWVKVTSDKHGAILFEDGEYYKSYKPGEIDNKNGILESLNGENNNYQFSARAMIERYKRHDMPLGWFVPNDGYGSGYGQTDSLDGDIRNLKEFADYAKENGVEVALWTESQLEPTDPDHPKKGERDLGKEVGVAGVVALKCDVAWIGSGYSFGLNAVENATNLFANNTKNNARPIIIMVDGWAGTQRYSGIWSGDQTGGKWEYIRFHIPTYIGTGLSGQPIVGSDMDGIYGGKDKEVNIRDYQWKAFTPLQLNMDGWGNIPKYPFSFDDEATKINRAYLKLKSMLMPYNYTIGHTSIHGLPMIRAMFLEFPGETPAHTKDSQYQFMWGPNVLVAPIYEEQNDLLGDPRRHGIYLPNPNQIWIDFFTGDKYQGGKIYNNFFSPLWKIPVFIKDGAIIPFTEPNNNPYEIKRDKRIFKLYPNGETSFLVYEDDGISTKYLKKHFAKTKITVIGPKSNEHGNLSIHIDKVRGSYNGITQKRATLIQIMASEDVEHIKAAVNGGSLKITEVKTDEEFNNKDNVYFFKKDFVVNPYLIDIGGDVLYQTFILIKIKKMDVTVNEIQIKINGYVNEAPVFGSISNLSKLIHAPSGFVVPEDKITSTSIPLQWNDLKDVIYYEIERDGVIFTNIIGNTFTFDGFKPETEHSFRIRSVKNMGISKWSYYIVVETKEDRYKHTVKGVMVTCNMPCQSSQEVCNLTDGTNSMWHTHWDKLAVSLDEGKIMKLYFDLGDVYEIDKVEYIPREDAGNGTLLRIQYRYSADFFDSWSPLSDPIDWAHDETVKKITFDGEKMRCMELQILDAIGGFGSRKHMFFYKKI